jgi:DivIVA domain-containing protein
MDELSPLFQEIEFHERWRGYDPDEVDAYVDRVAKAAAVIHGRLTELHERVESAESRGGGVAGESEETLTRTLVLAQRTADAAIAEAREAADRMTTDAATSAQAILSAAEAEAQVTLRGAQAEASATLKDAEDRAALVLAEAETDRRTMVAEAETLAAQAASTERERLAAEVAELQQYRAFLADDIEILERHLTEERHQLTVSLSALTDLLELPEAFRARPVPETSGVEVDESFLEGRVDDSGEPLQFDEPEPAEESLIREPVAEADAADPEVPPEMLPPDPTPVSYESVSFDPAPEPQQDAPMIDLVEADDMAPAAVEPVSSASAGNEDLDEAAPVEIDLDRQDDPVIPEIMTTSEENSYATMPGVGSSTPSLDEAGRGPASPPLLVTAADLDSPADLESVGAGTSWSDFDGGPATAPVPTIQESSLFSDPADTADDPFLAQLRDAVEGEAMPDKDDDALSAFFDHEEDDGSRSWFGRRR